MRVAVIGGDGIGPEVTRQAVRVLHAAAERFAIPLEVTDWDLGAERYLREGVTITEEEFAALASGSDAILLGALGDPRVLDNVHARDILLGLRFRLDLYVNYRPCELLAPDHCPLRGFESGRGIRLDVFRENTEDLYVNIGGTFKKGTPDEVAIQESINTRKGVERIVREAFAYAREHGRSPLTLVDKANAMPAAGGLWRRTFQAVSEEFADVETNMMYVDALAMDLVRRPDRYAVLVAPNLFGDIISDLAAEITGGLGLAPSANYHPGQHGLFEPVHGSAPDIAGRGTANPIGAIRSVGLMLERQGQASAARVVEQAVRDSVRERITTPDLGGDRSTDAVGEWIARRIETEA